MPTDKKHPQAWTIWRFRWRSRLSLRRRAQITAEVRRLGFRVIAQKNTLWIKARRGDYKPWWLFLLKGHWSEIR